MENVGYSLYLIKLKEFYEEVCPELFTGNEAATFDFLLKEMKGDKWFHKITQKALIDFYDSEQIERLMKEKRVRLLCSAYSQYIQFLKNSLKTIVNQLIEIPQSRLFLLSSDAKKFMRGQQYFHKEMKSITPLIIEEVSGSLHSMGVKYFQLSLISINFANPWMKGISNAPTSNPA